MKNPRANAIVERMHQVLRDMLRVQMTKSHDYDQPVLDMCAAAAYAIRATVHGTTRYSPSQLVYAKDMLLRTQVEANVENIRQRQRQKTSINALEYSVHVVELLLQGRYCSCFPFLVVKSGKNRLECCVNACFLLKSSLVLFFFGDILDPPHYGLSWGRAG